MAGSNITLGMLKAQLKNKSQGYSVTSPDDAFISDVNQVAERLINSGKWQGNIERVSFATVVSFITLPPQFVSCLGGTFNRCFPVPIWSQFHQYMENGPGMFNENCFWPWQLIDMGDTFSTQLDVVAPGPLLLKSNAADNTAICRVFGDDALTGEPVYDPATGFLGEPVALSAPSVTTTHQFASVTGFQKPSTKQPVNLWVSPSSGSPYQIGTYQPWETNPQYHRYQTGNVNSNTEILPAVSVLCQRRYLPVFSDTDWVYPGNMGAFKFGLQALNFENLNRTNDAIAQWEYAYKLMNFQTHTTRGGARVEVDISPWGSPGQGLDWTN